MTEKVDSHRRTPLGIILVCLLLGLYSFFWILTWILAGAVGNGIIALLSLVVAVGVLFLALFLYLGNRIAWWITITFIGGSTLWRLSLVAGGELNNLLNVVVGSIIFLYLVSRHEFYQPSKL